MHRQILNLLLARYREAWPLEAALVQRFVDFVAARSDCLLRSCGPGHITASAWIEDHTGELALLTHHKKLGRWLQLGGHVDGETAVERAALREAEEESGLSAFTFQRWQDELVPLDLDVHSIPARAAEPQHDHWDVRFWLRAGAGQPLVLSAESNDLRWFSPAELRSVTTEESVLRLARKAASLRRR